MVGLVGESSEDCQSDVQSSMSAVKMCFPSLSSFRLRHQTFEASHLVPEADGGLQERGHHRPDVLLEQRPGPLCPHPQVQASADVGISPGLQRRVLSQYLGSPESCA